MVFHRFDRQILVATESTEGTAETIAVGDFVECLEDVSYTITPFSLERPLVRPAFTSIPQYFASVGIASGQLTVSQIEFTFTVELTANSAGNASADPGWDALMIACGMEKFTGVKGEVITGSTITNGPVLHREQVTDSSDNTQSVGTHFTGDAYYYYTGDTPGTGSMTGTFGSSAPTFTCSTAGTAIGSAWGFSMDAAAGDGSSATIELGLDGRRVTAKGCRGNCSIQFTAMDRVLMTFTMMGIVHEITDSSANRTGISYGSQLPATFTNAGLSVMEVGGSTNHTAALFQSMTLDFGNEITMRQDANSGSGWKAAQVTGRAPTITVNPDAIAGGNTSATLYDYFEKWHTGTQSRMEWLLGTVVGGNSFHFKAPGVQWETVADGDRDNYTVYECTGRLTGGSFGDSVVHDATGATQHYDDKGADNELVIIAQ